MKKGVSLVTLIITIIILIILTAGVVMIGMGNVGNASLAVLESNISTVKEAVNTKMSSNLIKYSKERDLELYSWIGIIDGYTEEMAEAGETPASNKKILGTIEVAKLDIGLNEMLNMKEEEFEKYLIDLSGNVYYDGFEYEGDKYYAPNVRELEWVRNISTNANLNPTTPCITQIKGGVGYTVPIPKGFVPSTIEGETDISEGLVIYDTAVSPNNNQFVWVPVDNTYGMIGDITGEGIFHTRDNPPGLADIPYLDNNTTTALECWKDSINGHTGTLTNTTNTVTFTEPYKYAKDWEKNEYKAMVESVLKYGGFYVGRYETGGTVQSPVVKAGVNPICNIMWGSSLTERGEGTATGISNSMYLNSEKGVVSTLIYGIQWDSAMCWAKCHNMFFNASGDNCFNNIYNLVGGVAQELTMESNYGENRVRRGGVEEYTVSARMSFNNKPFESVGFRIALYVK